MLFRARPPSCAKVPPATPIATVLEIVHCHSHRWISRRVRPTHAADHPICETASINQATSCMPLLDRTISRPATVQPWQAKNKLTANRLNAQNFRGPVTTQGKAVSRLNSNAPAKCIRRVSLNERNQTRKAKLQNEPNLSCAPKGRRHTVRRTATKPANKIAPHR